jgi:hypothetical protein
MGMSASDAAPLPRLGEIFFDVRGSSRSMRLSWYSTTGANTGAAVFSIWQGGTCTGTFRLPVEDLTRLVDSLRRGVPGGQNDDSGPMALGGQRPRLAIGAAPAEPFTGMMTAVTDERAAAYGPLNGRQTGGFATMGTDPALGRNGAELAGLGDYAAGPQANGMSDQYGTAQFNGTAQQYGSDQYGTGSQYAGTPQYGTAQLNGTAQQYGQYGQGQQYGIEAGQSGQSRPGTDARTADQRADYQYGAAPESTQYGSVSGYADPGYGDTGYADTGSAGLTQQAGQQSTVQPGGYGGSAQYPARQQGESVPSYSTGPQPSYGFQASASQQSFGDGQAYAALGQAGALPGAGRAGFTYQGSGAPEASHGDDTGPQPAARYAGQAAYGQPQVQSYDANAYEARQQATPSRAGESYDPAYSAQGYGQQGYQQPGYGDRSYDNQGYAAPGRADQVPASPEFPSGAFANRGYTAPGQQDTGQASGQYQEYGYGQQPDQQEATAAQSRGQQAYGAQSQALPQQQAPALPQQQWPDTARAAQPATGPGYQAVGTSAYQAVGASALAAPVPADSGAGQQAPGPAPAAATFAGQQAGSYGVPVPEADRYATSYAEQPGYAQPAAYQAPAVQPDPARYPGTPSADVGGGAGAGYGTGTGGYQATAAGAAGGYGYDQQGYNGNGYTGGYGDSDRSGTGAFPAGYSAASAAGTGAYPEAPAANGYGSNGYAANGYQANGYPANGSGYSAVEAAERGSAPSGAYPRLPVNGYPAGYAGGTVPGNGQVNGTAPSAASTVASVNGAGYQPLPEYGQAGPNAQGAARSAAQPTFTPAFTANGATGQSGEAGGAGRPVQPAGAGYIPGPGYGAAPSGGAQAYPATPAYTNGNGAGYPAANGNGYPAANGTVPANGYPRDGYSSGQPTDPLAAGYPSGPNFAPAGQADQVQQGYQAGR